MPVTKYFQQSHVHMMETFKKINLDVKTRYANIVEVDRCILHTHTHTHTYTHRFQHNKFTYNPLCSTILVLTLVAMMGLARMLENSLVMFRGSTIVTYSRKKTLHQQS